MILLQNAANESNIEGEDESILATEEEAPVESGDVSPTNAVLMQVIHSF